VRSGGAYGGVDIDWLLTEQPPVEFCVEVESYEFDGAIGCELAD